MICYGCVYNDALHLHTCPKTAKPTFRVWTGDEDLEAAEDSYGRSYGHGELDDAVEEHAQHYHSHCDGWDSSWPVTFFVRELSTGKVFEVEVERDFDPVFSACTPVEVDVLARKVARWWTDFIRAWGPVGQCLNRAPAGYVGHWKEWHRGHMCSLDPDRDEGRVALDDRPRPR